MVSVLLFYSHCHNQNCATCVLRHVSTIQKSVGGKQKGPLDGLTTKTLWTNPKEREQHLAKGVDMDEGKEKAYEAGPPDRDVLQLGHLILNPRS